METNHNTHKSIMMLLKRLVVVLVAVSLSLYFYVGNARRVLAREKEEIEVVNQTDPVEVSIEVDAIPEQDEYRWDESLVQPEFIELLTDGLSDVERLLDELTTTPYSEELHKEARRILDFVDTVLENYPNDLSDVTAYYNEQKERLERYETAIADAMNSSSNSEELQIEQMAEDGMITQAEGTGTMNKTKITVKGITLKFYEVDEEFILSHKISTGDIILNDEEFIEFCKVIYKEAGNQGTTGQIIVGNSILNRMRKYRMSLHEVIIQPGQFASIRGVSESKITDEIRESAMMALASDYTQGTLQEIAEAEGLSEDYYTPGYYFYNPYGCEEDVLHRREYIRVAFRYKDHICYGVK